MQLIAKTDLVAKTGQSSRCHTARCRWERRCTVYRQSGDSELASRSGSDLTPHHPRCMQGESSRANQYRSSTARNYRNHRSCAASDTSARAISSGSRWPQSSSRCEQRPCGSNWCLRERLSCDQNGPTLRRRHRWDLLSWRCHSLRRCSHPRGDRTAHPEAEPMFNSDFLKDCAALCALASASEVQTSATETQRRWLEDLIFMLSPFRMGCASRPRPFSTAHRAYTAS